MPEQELLGHRPQLGIDRQQVHAGDDHLGMLGEIDPFASAVIVAARSPVNACAVCNSRRPTD